MFTKSPLIFQANIASLENVLKKDKKQQQKKIKPKCSTKFKNFRKHHLLSAINQQNLVNKKGLIKSFKTVSRVSRVSTDSKDENSFTKLT